MDYLLRLLTAPSWWRHAIRASCVLRSQIDTYLTLKHYRTYEACRTSLLLCFLRSCCALVHHICRSASTPLSFLLVQSASPTIVYVLLVGCKSSAVLDSPYFICSPSCWRHVGCHVRSINFTNIALLCSPSYFQVLQEHVTSFYGCTA